MEKEIVLSICITSYNRGSLLKKNLEKMMSFSSDEIEFVVSDNASTDNTMELLSTIDDKRLNVYRNEENLGFTKNAICAAMRARGKYFLRMNDRDYLNPNVLPKVLEWVKEENADFYIVDDDYLKEVREKPVNKQLSYKEKVYWLKKTRHPGEIIYRREMYKQFWENKKYCEMNERQVVYYALRYMFHMAENQIGTHKTISKFLVQPNINQKKSLGQGRKEVWAVAPYFLPKIELKDYKVTQRVIEQCVPKELQLIAIRECYRIALGFVTFEFKDCISSDVVCQRYGYVPPKKVYWWFVHVRYFMLTIKCLKKKGLLSLWCCTQMLLMTVKNYYCFVKKYKEL